MAIKLPKFFSASDAKSRVFFIFAGLTAIGLIVYAIVYYFSGGPTTSGPSKVAGAPSGLQSVPGAQMTPEFYRAVSQANTQAAQQAQISGGSAVPTLINVPNQPAGFGGNTECTVLCPGDEAANVADDINNIVKLGKLPQDDANRLIDMAKNNVSVDEYAAALNDLVRQGKLTPEQARSLLEKYKKQHANALVNDSAKVMDTMIRNGQLPLDVANQLLALQKKGATPAEYAAELNRLVREGKISPELAAQLLAQYTQQQAQEEAKKGIFAIQQMARAGQITPEVAALLTDMQNRNVPVDEYEAELKRLVAAGKMTPEAAAKLLEQYKKQRAGLGTTGILNAELGKVQAENTALLNDLVKSGKLPADLAAILYQLQQRCATKEEYQAALTKGVQDKKITADVAKLLMDAYQKVSAMCVQTQRLAALQANNASLDDYANELKRAVQAGLISPETATRLYEQYRALVSAAPTAGVAPGVETNVPGSEAFNELQQRLEAAAPVQQVTTPEFNAPPPTAVAAATENPQDRQIRIQQLQAAMAAQAQALLAAWAPPTMVERVGSPETKTTGGGAPGTPGAAAGGAAGAAGKIAPKKALIKAGTILFAVLDTAVDSDYPDTPVMATIVQGPLSGAKLLGKLALVPGKDRLSLTFSMMDKDEWPSTKSITAFAIDPDTARTVLASSVDYHYLQRYGAIMATSFLSGYSSAVTNAGTSTTGIFGTSTTHPELSAGNKIAVALGQIGTNLNSVAASYINTPPTVKVNSGVGLGILFMAEVTD